IGGLALIEPGLRNLVENRSANAKRVPSVAMGIPHNADPRREVRQVPVPVRRGNSRVARKEQSGGRIRIPLAELPGIEAGNAEGAAALVLIGIGEGGLP